MGYLEGGGEVLRGKFVMILEVLQAQKYAKLDLLEFNDVMHYSHAKAVHGQSICMNYENNHEIIQDLNK